jgi:hypothetical protein
MRTARAVPTPGLCRKTMISRTTFCSAQAAVMRLARTGPAVHFLEVLGFCLDGWLLVLSFRGYEGEPRPLNSAATVVACIVAARGACRSQPPSPRITPGHL